MNKGSRVRYEWASAGGPVNVDIHGDLYDAPKNGFLGLRPPQGVAVSRVFVGANTLA